MKSIILFFALLHFISAQIIFPGNCPELTPLTNVRHEKLLGYWYTAKYFPTNESKGLKCAKDHLKTYENGKFEAVFTAVVTKTNEKVTMPYVLKFKSNPSVADFLSEVNFRGKTMKYEAKLVSTDYDNYALFWNCKEIGPNNHRVVFVQSRTPTPSEDVLKKVHEFMDAHNLGSFYLVDFDNTNCVHL